MLLHGVIPVSISKREACHYLGYGLPCIEERRCGEGEGEEGSGWGGGGRREEEERGNNYLQITGYDPLSVLIPSVRCPLWWQPHKEQWLAS